MAHAVRGSAYSAKGGNLKFADVVRERFRGPAFGQDFTTWLDEVLLGFETANISESSQVTHLMPGKSLEALAVARGEMRRHRRRREIQLDQVQIKSRR